MTNQRINLGRMKTVAFILLFHFIIRTDSQSEPPECLTSLTNRPPEDKDITVTCGTEFMDLSIFLCPIYNASYNESLMVLNDQSSEECKGTADFTVDPPVLRFRFPISEKSLSACKNDYLIINEIGNGTFVDFSNVQFVVVSGLVVTVDPASGLITYRPQITYKFSCKYPLHYFLDNTPMTVGGVDLAINENDGSFISTVKLKLYSNEFYDEPLVIPQTGLPLKTKIFVEVSATNLADRFNVFLLVCMATVEINANASQRYYLLVGCEQETHTTIIENGVSEKARFVFEAFRFLEHQSLEVSTFYLHCYISLCHKEECPDLVPDCTREEPEARRKREASDTNRATVTSPAILVSKLTSAETVPASSQAAKSGGAYSSPVVAVIVCVAVLSLLLVGMGTYITWTIKHKVPV